MTADLTSGYHQMVLHPFVREKAAFDTHIGTYEWLDLQKGSRTRTLQFLLTRYRRAIAISQPQLIDTLFGYDMM
jgi:hypothetical protein